MSKVDLDKSMEMTDITFDHEDAHLALCHSSQGAANGWNKALLLKSETPEVKEDLIKALEQVTVKLSMQDFLRKFFDMWYDDAEMLTKLLGFETESEYRDSQEDTYSHEAWLEERVEGITIMKSAKEGNDLTSAEQLELLKFQVKFEHACESNGVSLDVSAVADEEDLNKTEVTVKKEDILKSEEFLALLKEKEDLQKAADAADAEKKELIKSLGEAEGKIEERESELELVKSELGEFVKEKEDILKSALGEFVGELGFVEEEKQEEFSEFLFKAKDVDGIELVHSVLKAAKVAVEGAKDEFLSADTGEEVNAGDVEETDPLIKHKNKLNEELIQKYQANKLK